MPRYEVHIPAVDTTGFNFTFRVDADTWMTALKTGMRKLGEQGAHGQNVLVDIQEDNTLHVTEPESGRVFQIRELSEQEAASAQVKRPVKRPTPNPVPIEDRGTEPMRVRPSLPESQTIQEMPVVTPLPAPRTPASPAKPPGSSGERPVPSGRSPAVSGPHARAPEKVPRESQAPRYDDETTRATRRPSAPRQPPSRHESASVVELERPVRPVGAIGRKPQERRATREDIESILTEVFERVQAVNGRRSEEEALYFLLDLALEKIPAEAGTIFRADAATGDLRFEAVRGPRAQELLRANLVVPAGTGIVGFCATEGVSVALSDVQKDPRYWAAVAAKVNYETRSVLCSPMMTDGRTYGCVQLINKKGTPLFTELEIGIVTYVAHQAALYLASRD